MNPSLLIKCPVCGASLQADESGRSFRCCGVRKSHCFDIAAGGYVNLISGHASGGDSKEAVRARTAFLEKDHYATIGDAVIEILREVGNINESSLVVDAGCGDGYYLNRALRTLGCRGLGFDLSKFAVDHAAKSARRGGLSEKSFYAVSSVFELPLADACADAVINLFAPCVEAEYCRVLKPGGALVVVGAGEEHLYELKKAVYDEVYLNDTRADLPNNMELIERRRVDFTVSLTTPEEIESLFSMTPYYYRTSKEGVARLAATPSLAVDVDAEILIYRK
jgi:23S rRNA (guanine745-N1)-methyltransferase